MAYDHSLLYELAHLAMAIIRFAVILFVTVVILLIFIPAKLFPRVFGPVGMLLLQFGGWVAFGPLPPPSE